MEYFDFNIKFDDPGNTLNRKNGLGIGRVGEILRKLSKMTNSGESNTVVLSEIRGNCYNLTLSTKVASVNEHLKIVHERISDGDYAHLDDTEKDYAKYLRILSEDDLRITVYDTNSDFKLHLSKIPEPVKPLPYYVTSTIKGKLISIGSKSEEGKSMIRVSGFPPVIELNTDQEAKLIEYFKNLELTYTVKNKFYTGDDKIIKSTLLNFRKPIKILSGKEADLADKQYLKLLIDNNMVDDEN